jgi:hypothetical protein
MVICFFLFFIIYQLKYSGCIKHYEHKSGHLIHVLSFKKYPIMHLLQ